MSTLDDAPDDAQVVIQAVSRKTGISVSRLSLQDRLLQDLLMDGDDAVELFIELSKRYEIDLSTLDITKHFRPEPNLFSVLRFPSTKRAELAAKRPITIADLIQAVRSGKWSL